ncbi:MAG: hypothetical protein KIT84_38845 [Labilithrix sp.]|nr:hypothetical protein [Labilithrix sp.]MCW5817020.1 hypothetical protein [Labilithrix sp.]
MSVVAHLCGLAKAERRAVVVASPPELRAAVAEAEREGYGLIEPDLPIGRVALPKDVVDRAVLALVARGRPRELLFVRGERAAVRKVRDAAALDLDVALHADLAQRDAASPVVPAAASVLAQRDAASPIVGAAMCVLAERGVRAPIRGKELLREARARHRASASASDAAALAKALVRAWNDGLVVLTLR